MKDHSHSVGAAMINNSSKNELAHILLTHIIIWCITVQDEKMYHEVIILNNNILQQVHCTHFLGIIIDDKLKCANHITYSKNKIAKGMGILLKTSKVLKYKCFCSYTILCFFSIHYLLFQSMWYCFEYSHPPTH